MIKFRHFHPLLLGIYPVLFLYAVNVQEILLSEIVLPLTIAIAAASVLWISFGLCLKDYVKAGIAADIIIVAFYSYGVLFSGLARLNHEIPNRYLMPVVLLIAYYGVYFVIKAKINWLNVSRVLTFTLGMLLIINIIMAAPQEIEKYKSRVGGETNAANEGSRAAGADAPDIYYIVLDEYASLDTIRSIWGYDNSGFADYLKNKGFYIAEKSVTRYISTVLALPSYLNMEYLPQDLSVTQRYKFLNDNKVMRFLKERGYTTIALDSWYGSGNKAKGNYNADYNYNHLDNADYRFISSGFVDLLLKGTMLRPIRYLDTNNGNNIYKLANLYTLNRLKEVPAMAGPKFIFAHVFSPHAPFVFGRNGEDVDSNYENNWKEKKYYLDQYIYITGQIRIIVDAITEKSSRTPIIIIQSDHGPRPQYNEHSLKKEKFDLPEEHMVKIFNAFLLPDGGEKILTEDISPADTFRLIFDYYFRGNPPRS